jgi:hypothetical protein
VNVYAHAFHVFRSEAERNEVLIADESWRFGKLLERLDSPREDRAGTGGEADSPQMKAPKSASPSPPALESDGTIQKVTLEGRVQSVVDELDPRGGLQIQDRGRPEGPAWRAMLGGLSSGPFPGPPWSASGYTSHARMALVGRSLGWPSEPREGPAPGAARAPTQLLLVSLGKSTGEAFKAWLIGDGPLPKKLLFDGLVAEPLSKEAQRQVARQIEQLAGRKAVSARVDAYCLEFQRLPPPTGRIFRVAGPELQRAHEPARRILRASRWLRDGKELNPDSDPADYFHSIRQWAFWTAEQGFDERAYGDAFVSHTRKNLEGSGRKWTREMEPVLRRALPNRWRDIQAVLRAAGLR